MVKWSISVHLPGAQPQVGAPCRTDFWHLDPIWVPCRAPADDVLQASARIEAPMENDPSLRSPVKTLLELRPVIDCIVYCVLHFESLVKCKMHAKSMKQKPQVGWFSSGSNT